MHNFGVMTQGLLNGENRFLPHVISKELGGAKRSGSTTSARSALRQPWSIIGRNNIFERPQQTSILSNRNCFKLLVKMISAFPIARCPSFKFLMQMWPSASRARNRGPFYPRPCSQTGRTASTCFDDLASGYRTRGGLPAQRAIAQRFRVLAPLRHADQLVKCLFVGVDRK
jgi:hypothetical protein